MTVELWNAAFQWGAAVFVLLAFVCVGGAMWTSNLLHERQAARLRAVEGELSGARAMLAGQQPRGSQADNARTDPAPRAEPRTLDAAARATLLDALRRASPDGPLAIRFISAGNAEPAAFARVLADVIEEAGWTLGGDSDDNPAGPTIGEPPVGLLVRVAAPGDVPRRAVILEEALNRASLGARIERLATVKQGVVELMVGVRP